MSDNTYVHGHFRAAAKVKVVMTSKYIIDAALATVVKGRKEAVNVIMGKDDRLLVVVEVPSDVSIARMQRALDKKSVEPEETPHQQSEPAKEPEVKLTIEEVEEEDGAMLNKYKVTVVMKKPQA